MDCWIAVVDDEDVSLTLAKVILGSEGMQVSCLKSGAELLKFMERNSPDIILLDVMMPEMDGFETLKRLREFEEKNGRKQTPVFFITGENDSEAEHEGLRIGASDYIHKPINKDILIRRIQNTVTNSRKIESLTEDATTDKLTGFLNKTAGIEKIREKCRSVTGALMMMDLDSFKLVNDLYGHEIGDKIIVAFSEVVKKNIRNADIICRTGGDEFVGFFSDLTEELPVAALTGRLNAQFLKRSYEVLGQDHGIPLGISIGVVMTPANGRDYDALIKLADEAMYEVKDRGKHGYYIYRDEGSEKSDGDDPVTELSRLVKIIEERNDSGEALILGMESFSSVYHFIMRFNRRYDGKAVLILFVISVRDPEDEGMLKSVMADFGNIMKSTMRRSDLILQSKSNQYLLLLPMMTEPNAERVVQRIMEAWEKCPSHELAGIEYVAEMK